MANDNVMHQGKTVAQWEKDFNGMFTKDQLLKLIRGGCDLQKILVSGLDEDETQSINDKALFKGEEFFFNEASTADEEAALNEAFDDNIVTVKDFVSALKRNLAKDEDKLMFRIKKQAAEVFDIHSKGGTTVVDLIPAIANGSELNEATVLDPDIDTVSDLVDEISGITKAPNSTLLMIVGKDGTEYSINALSEQHGRLVMKISPTDSLNESAPWEDESGITDEQWEEASNWFEANGFKIHDSDEGGFTFTKPINGKYFYTGKDGYDLYLKMKGATMNEGRNWRTGGYGGYGRSYRSYGEIGAPRGRDISWFEVSELDPKARGKMSEWRVGPSNFPFKDLLYPERKYKRGTTVLRSKFLKAGDESGVKYIAVPSYLDAIKNNDEAAIKLMKSLGIPLDLTFGYKPGEDFSATYVVQA